MADTTTKTKKPAVKKEKVIAPKEVVAAVSVSTPDEPVIDIVKSDRYYEGLGRRKTSVARVRLFTKRQGILVNDKSLAEYFPLVSLQKRALSPLEKMKIADKLGAVVKVYGGGITGQAEAVRLGIARALVTFNVEFKKRLRRIGYLTRDSRAVERKKYGLKKARRAPQWNKR